MANGKLFIIEAGDGSGKETQTRLLTERLVREGHRVVPVTPPCSCGCICAAISVHARTM